MLFLIANYKITKLLDLENYHTVWNLRERKHKNKILTKDIELHILEIPKIRNTDIKKDELALWLKFIENPKNEEVEKNMEESECLKQAKEELAYLSSDPDFKRLVDARAGFLRDQNTFEVVGMEKGIEKGIEKGKAIGKLEGEKNEKIKIAKKLLEMKMPIKQIAEITGLTEKEIEKLKK